MCSDCEAYGLKRHGLTRSDCIYICNPRTWLLQLDSRRPIKMAADKVSAPRL